MRSRHSEPPSQRARPYAHHARDPPSQPALSATPFPAPPPWQASCSTPSSPPTTLQSPKWSRTSPTLPPPLPVRLCWAGGTRKGSCNRGPGCSCVCGEARHAINGPLRHRAACLGSIRRGAGHHACVVCSPERRFHCCSAWLLRAFQAGPAVPSGASGWLAFASARPTPRCGKPPVRVAELGQLPGEEGFWRFNRTKDYGLKGANETPEQLKATFGWS